MAYSTLLTTNNAFAVTKSDSAKIDAFGIYVGTTGDVSLMPYAQESAATPTAVVFSAVPAGSIISLHISRVMSTGTSASNIVAFGPT